MLRPELEAGVGGGVGVGLGPLLPEGPETINKTNKKIVRMSRKAHKTY